MRRACCLGGPYDGEYFNVTGAELRYPGRPDHRYFARDEIPLPTGFRIGRYRLERDVDGQFVYVHVEHP